MSFECFTRITIRHDDKEKLEALHGKIGEWTSENFIDNGWGEMWLGNVVGHSGIAQYVKGEFVAEDGEEVHCEGEISDLHLGRDELQISTLAAGSMMEIWRLVCDKYLPGAEIIFTTFAPEYRTNDPKMRGKFAIEIEDPPEEFADEGSWDEADAEDVVKFLQRVLKTDEDDLEELLELARGEDWFTVEPWEYCEISASYVQ